MTRDSNRTRRPLVLLKAIAAAGALGWLLGTDRLDFGDLAFADRRVLAWGLVPLVFVNLAAQALRWYCLLRSQGMQTPLLRVASLAWIGNFWATVSPGGLGGEVARGYLIWRWEPHRKPAAVVSVVADRGLGLVAFLFLSVAAWGWLPSEGRTPASGWIGVLSLTLLGLTVLLLGALGVSDSVFFRRPSVLQAWAAGSKRFVSEALSRAGWTAAAGALAFVAAAALVGSFSLAALSLGSPLDLRTGFLVVPHVVIANTVPISPGGVGVGEAAASILFQEVGRSDGAELMILVRVVIYLLRLPGALILLTLRE